MPNLARINRRRLSSVEVGEAKGTFGIIYKGISLIRDEIVMFD
jgi:hypothetical protein